MANSWSQFIGCVLLTTLYFNTTALAEDNSDIPIIDTHVHLWDLNRPEDIYWIPKDNNTLYRSMLPQVHEPIALANQVKGVVVVQAGQSLPDNQWNLDITAHNKQLYRGVVGNLSEVVGTENFSPLFQHLCKDERYVGFRLSGRHQNELSDAFFRDLKISADQGKTVDILLGKYSLEDVATIAERVPSLRIIIDHFGGVQLDGQPLNADWIQQFKAVGKYPNVYCKVSALYGRFKQQPAPADIEPYQEIMNLALDCFSEDRLVFGSDWPVSRTTGDYASVIRLTRNWADGKGRDLVEKLFYRNAMKFYGVQLP